MIELAIALLWLLIGIAVICAVFWVIIWFLGTVIGLPLPARAIQIGWGIVALICLIYILTFLSRGALPLPGL